MVLTKCLSCSYDKCGRVVTPANTCNQPQTKSKKHFRSASCDVKMIKSFARDHSSSSGPADAAGQDAVGASTKYKNLKKFQAHTRNHSTDLHDPSQPIRYIQNQLRPQDCPEEDDDEELTTGCGHFVKSTLVTTATTKSTCPITYASMRTSYDTPIHITIPKRM